MNERLTLNSFGFIGLGLIGGSIARAIREHHPGSRILVYDPDPETMTLAVRQGIASETAAQIDDTFLQCDCVFLCAPVSDNADNLTLLKAHTSDSCLLTDVGSVKTSIHEQVSTLFLNDRFIGGHPMAGSERTGFINSKALLLQNAYYILTPGKSVPEKTITLFRDFIESIGSVPLVMDYQTHDHITGAVSHLPHVVSASLVHLLKDSDTPDELMKTIAAGGFKDITRISSSSPVMWQQICLTNKANITALLEKYIAQLQSVKKLIDESQEQPIYDFFREAQKYRDSFSDISSGPIKRSYVIHVEIADQPGALTSVTVLLARHSVSIKNIGIVHNREQTDGVLRIEVYQERSLAQADELLKANGYTTYIP